MQRVDLQKRLWNRYLRLPPELSKGPVFLAVSGGMDSSVLAAVALGLREQLPSLHFVHVNYHLRIPDSDREEASLRAWAKREGIPIHVLRLHPKKKPKNLQAWARERRLAFFRNLVATKGRDRGLVWMAHHQSDQAETVLGRLLRGAGLKGLRGMDPLEDMGGLWVFRPFLEVPQEALRIYAEAHRLVYHHDRSNDGLDYQRNRIRHRVLPLLRQENPRVLEVLADFAARAGEAAGAIDGLAQAWLEKRSGTGKSPPAALAASSLRRLAPGLRVAILESWLRGKTQSEQSFAKILPALLAGLEAGKKNFDLPLKGGFRVTISPKTLTLRRRSGRVRS